MYILEKIGLSVEILESLSYRTDLKTSMKRTLRHFDKEEVIKDVRHARQWYNMQDILYKLPVDLRI